MVTNRHIGDSRCLYGIRGGNLAVTEDHSLVNELVRHGEISKRRRRISPEKECLLRALGTEEKVGLDVKTVVLEEDDQLLLCSDGRI